MGEFLNFQEISKVKFSQLLERLNIPFTETATELKGQGFIVNQSKNIYFNPTGKDKGSIINFLAAQKSWDLRQAAKFLKDEFLNGETKERKIPELELEYHPYLEELGIPADLAKGLTVGFCKQKSIMSGRICFKVGSNGYVGYNPKDKSWLFPKNFKRDTLWNIENCDKDIILIARDLFAALKMVAKGYHYTASIMGNAPTEEQKEIIKRYEFAFIC